MKTITIINTLKKAGFQKWNMDENDYGFQVKNFDGFFQVTHKMYCSEADSSKLGALMRLPKFNVTEMTTMYRDALRDAGYECSLPQRINGTSYNTFNVTSIKGNN